MNEVRKFSRLLISVAARGSRVILQFVQTHLSPPVAFTLLFAANLLIAYRSAKTFGFMGVPITANVDQAVSAWGASDAGSYLRAGVSFVTSGGYDSTTRWIQILWPPGMPVLWYLAISLMGFGGRVLFFIVVVSALLWSLAFTLVFKVLENWIPRLLIACVIGLVLASAIYHDLVMGLLVVFSDGPAAALSLAAVTSVAVGNCSRSGTWWWALGGVLLGLTSYVRGQYFQVVLVLAISSIVWLGVSLIAGLLRRLHRRGTEIRVSRALSIVALASVAVCIPNLAYRVSTLGVGNGSNPSVLTWTAAQEIISVSSWRRQEDIYFKGSTDGAACTIDPAQCDEIYAIEDSTSIPFAYNDSEGLSGGEFTRRMLKTYLTHPIQFVRLKVPKFVEYWYSEPSLANPGRTQVLGGSISLLGFVTSIVIASGLIVRSRRWRFAAIFYLLFVAGALVPPFIAHFETRYLSFTQVAGYLTFYAVVAFGLARVWSVHLKHLVSFDQSSENSARKSAISRM